MKKLLIALGALLLVVTVAVVALSIMSSSPQYRSNQPYEPTTQPEPEPEPGPVEITLQFAGDVLLHQGPTGSSRLSPGVYDFRPTLTHIRPFLNADLSLVNMETPVDVLGDNRDITHWPRFNVPFEVLEALDYAGFDRLITANNHSVDRGFDGLLATINNIERAGLTQTGMYATQEDFDTLTVLDVNGVQVGLIAYTWSLNGLDPILTPEQNSFAVRRFNGYSLESIPAMAEDFARLREAGAEVVVVSLHWGLEYVDGPTNMQMQIGRALVEAGADIIMGHHSHTPQPLEWHEREDGSRGLIIYSLSNFLADQTRLNPPDPRTQYGMVVQVRVVRYPDGTIDLREVIVLPTVCIRDRAGTTLRVVDDITVLPIIGGELPAGFELFSEQARLAYAHMQRVVGDEWLGSWEPNN